MGLKIINICQPFLLARIPSQNPFAIGCKRSPLTVEIRLTVGVCKRSRPIAFIERRAVFGLGFKELYYFTLQCNITENNQFNFLL